MKKDISKELAVINNLNAIKDYIGRFICEIVMDVYKEDYNKYSYQTKLSNNTFEIYLYNSITKTCVSKIYLLADFLLICSKYDNLVLELNTVIRKMLLKSRETNNQQIEL